MSETIFYFPSRPPETFTERRTPDEQLLWPPAPYSPRMRPGAAEYCRVTFGDERLDVGAVKLVDGAWLTLVGGPRWAPYERDSHLGATRKYYRMGPGHSRGPGTHNLHFEPRGWFEEAYGHAPDEITAEDLDYDRALYERVSRDYRAKLGLPPEGTIDEGDTAGQLAALPPRVEVTLRPGETMTVEVELSSPLGALQWSRRLERAQLPAGVTVTASPPGGRLPARLSIVCAAGEGAAAGSGTAELVIAAAGGRRLVVPVALTVAAAELPPPLSEPEQRADELLALARPAAALLAGDTERTDALLAELRPLAVEAVKSFRRWAARRG
jgi:hypothetical protein